MRTRTFLLPVSVLTLLSLACSGRPSRGMQREIAERLTRQVKDAYDPSKPDMVKRLMSLYPDSGRVVSAAAGRVIASRDTLGMGIRAFYENVVVNMRDPKWIWDQMLFDVLSRNVAVMTATYHVPHHTPRGEPHEIGGAWTAVFEKRGGRWYVVQEHLSDLPAPSAMDTMRP